jgi:hypothetical protein
MARAPWAFTEAELKTLRGLRAERSVKEIAVVMGRSVGAVRAQLNRLGVRRTYGELYPLRTVRLTRAELGYLAGLIDGEGTVTVGLSGNTLKPQVVVSNTSVAMMEWLQTRIPGPGAWVARTRAQQDGKATVYQFMMLGLRWVGLWRAVLPLLVVKGPQMRLVIEYAELRRAQHCYTPALPRHDQIIVEVRRLNTKPSLALRAAASATSPSLT